MLVVFAVALGIRVLHVWLIHREPFFTLRLGDADVYDAWARRIAAGDWVGHQVFYQAPLYPYFLAVIYLTLGPAVLTVRLVQAVLSAAACALLAGAGWRLFSKQAGLVAGFMLALYPPSIFLDTLLQKSALDLFFLCLALWLLSRLLAAPGRAVAWWLGVSLGGLMLVRENTLILVAPLLVWFALQRAWSPRRRLALAGLFVAGLGVVLVPVAIRNGMVGGEFYVTTAQFGPNFYIGNNPHADGTYKSLRPMRGRAAVERKDATTLAERALGRTLTPAEVSGYYTGQALDFIRTQPGRWVQLLLRKFALTWNTTEIADTEDQYTYAGLSWPLRLEAIWNLGVLAPLACLGLWSTRDDWRRLWLLHLMLAAYVASVVLFYVFARYRYPMVPFLVLFAAAGVTRLRAFVRERGRGDIAGCAAATVAVAVFCNWPMIPRNRLEAVTHYNFGVGFERRHQPALAVQEYHAALALDPALVVAHNDLGLLLGRQGHLRQAARELETVVRLDPTYATAQNNLGVVLGQQGDLRDALAHFEAAIRIDPRNAEAHNNLGQMLAAQGRITDARAEYEQAARLDPRYAEARRNLARLDAAQGRFAEAAAEYRQALALAPDDAATHAALAQVLVRTGDVDQAAAEFQRAVALRPDDPAILNDFGILLAGAGRLDAAAAQFQRAIVVAPDGAEAHNNLGIVLAQQGHTAEAAAEFRQAISLDPGYDEARRNLARLHVRP